MENKFDVFTPANQRVLIKPLDNKDIKSKSGLYLPKESELNKTQTGLIIAVGRGELDNPMLYHKGQIAIFGEYAGLDITLDINEDGPTFYKIMDQRDIIGTLVKNK